MSVSNICGIAFMRRWNKAMLMQKEITMRARTPTSHTRDTMLAWLPSSARSLMYWDWGDASATDKLLR